jgi:hypothetical protein
MTPTTPKPDTVDIRRRTTTTEATRTVSVTLRQVVPGRHSHHPSSATTGIPQSGKKRRILAGDKPPLRDGYSPPSVMLVPPKHVGPPEGEGQSEEIEATSTLHPTTRNFGQETQLCPNRRNFTRTNATRYPAATKAVLVLIERYNTSRRPPPVSVNALGTDGES